MCILSSMEAQLTCAICTDILYQPVQLHDCEHYFCGWCAREWLRHHLTCPACRMTPTRAGPSRIIDNMLEAFLEEHADLAPSEQRRADHASYTPGEDLLGPLSGRSSGSNNPATGLSSQPRQVPSIRTPSLSRARSASSRMSPAATPVAAISRGPAVSSIRNHEEVEEVPRLPPREVRRAVTPSVLRPVISEPRSVTPYSVLSPLYSPPTSPHATGQHYGHSYYSPQPISVNNYTVHNHYYNQTPSWSLPTPPAPSSGVVVNGAALDAVAITSLLASGVNPAPSRYWYDSRSGLWGYEGGPSSGVLRAGLYLGGPLRADASGATFTSIFANGRELPHQDLASLRNAGINPVPGQRLWINADGSCGVEGSLTVDGNVFIGNNFSRGLRLGAFVGGLLLGSLFR